MLESAVCTRDSSKMPYDLLTGMLELIQMRCGFFGRLTAYDAIKGASGCFMAGMTEPAQFRAGDILLMNGTSRSLR